jgi:hypothetical protein
MAAQGLGPATAERRRTCRLRPRRAGPQWLQCLYNTQHVGRRDLEPKPLGVQIKVVRLGDVRGRARHVAGDPSPADRAGTLGLRVRSIRGML